MDKRDVALKSPNMEREGFKKSIDTLINKGVKISKVVTDASTQVISTVCKFHSVHMLLTNLALGSIASLFINSFLLDGIGYNTG